MEDLTEAGVSIAAIGTGDISYARHFKAQKHIAFPLLVDEARTSYRLVNAGRTKLSAVLAPRVVSAAARAAARGLMQGRTGRDPLLLGATHLLGPGEAVPFAWVNADYADNAPITDVLAVAQNEQRRR